MSCVVRWWDVLFVKVMHFSSKNARLLNYEAFGTIKNVNLIFYLFESKIFSEFAVCE